MNRPVPSTLSVRVLFAIRRRGGRKLVITPRQHDRALRPRIESALLKAIAHAPWPRILESWECASTTELAAARSEPTPRYRGRLLHCRFHQRMAP